MSLIILLLPLLSFLALIFVGKRLSRQGDWLATASLFICLILAALVLFAKLTLFPQPITFSFPWINFGTVPLVGPLQVFLGLTIDNLSAVMLVVVTLVSSLVHLFSIGYMEGDSRYSRYFAYLGIFTFSMLIIVLTSNFFTMYV